MTEDIYSLKNVSSVTMKNAFVIGNPITHSLSPRLHSYWLEKYKIQNCSYTALQIDDEKSLSDFLNFIVSSKTSVVGTNITIPFKSPAFEILQKMGVRISPIARIVRAINLLYYDGEWMADNSDYIAVKTVLEKKENLDVTLFGAGGMSNGIISALMTTGVNKINLVNRTLDNAKDLASMFPNVVINPIALSNATAVDQAVASSKIVINSSVIGMKSPDEKLSFDHSLLKDKLLIIDSVYSKDHETYLSREATNLGIESVNGLDLLIMQAIPSFQKFFTPPTDVTIAMNKISSSKEALNEIKKAIL